MCEYVIRYFIKPLNWTFLVETNSQKVYLDVLKLMGSFSEFETDNIDMVAKAPIISIYASEGVYSVDYKGKKHIVDVTDNYERLIFIIYELIFISFENTDIDLAIFHGAVLSKNNDCVAIMAPTQTGKSSFSINYMAKGFEYMSDDYVLFNIKTQQCISFPKPVAIRNKDFLILKEVEQLSAMNNEGIKVSLIIPEKHVSILDNKALKTVLFIERKECLPEPFVIEQIKQATLFRKLLFNSHIAGNISINRKIVTVLESISGYNVLYRPGLEVFEKLDINELM